MLAARALFAAALCLDPLAAKAEFRVCNETDVTASIAIGYNDAGTWTSEGWWNVAAGDCTVVVGGDLAKSFYYWRAEAAGHDWERSRYMFCTSDEVFTIAGDTDCAARGYVEEAFNEIALDGATSHTLTLTAAAPMTTPGAQTGAPETDPPGTHGEPYSISGIFSHCEIYDVTMACEIHADGYRYVANSADPTPQSLLEDLDRLPLNTPIRISGDMIFYEGNTAEVTIREFTPGGRDSFAHIRDELQGLWESEDGLQVQIHGGLWEELLLGMPVFSFPMFIDAECALQGSASPVINLRSADTGEWESCFVILDLTETRLHIAYAEAGGGRVFRRVD